MVKLYILPRGSNGVLKILKYFEKIIEKDLSYDLVVLLPSNICYTVPLSAMYSRAKIKLYDIDFGSLYPDFMSLKDKFMGNELVVFLCVIPYGSWSVYNVRVIRDRLVSIWKDRIHIIWDCALVFPTYEILEYIFNNCGQNESFLFSFSYAKPIDLGFGAVLFTKLSLDSFSNVLDRKKIALLVNKVDKNFRKYFYLDKLKLKSYSFLCYNSELDLQDQKYLYSLINKILLKKDFEIVLRKDRSISYYELMDIKRSNNSFFYRNLGLLEVIEILSNYELDWRFNIRVSKDLRDRLINGIFGKGAFVSRLFPNISKHLYDYNSYPNSSAHWLRIINLFNDKDIDYNLTILSAIEDDLKVK